MLSHLIKRIQRRRTGSHNRAIVLDELQAIYVSIPKVACTSLKYAMAEWLGLELSEKQQIHNAAFKFAALSELSRKPYQSYYKFVFVRNPWDRLVSFYSNKIANAHEGPRRKDGIPKALHRFGMFRAEMPFEEVVEAVLKIPDSKADKHFRSLCTFIPAKRGHLLVDFVGKFENLDQDFQQVCRSIGANGGNLPHRKKSNRTAYRKYYETRTAELVRNRYAKDIKLFGYEF